MTTPTRPTPRPLPAIDEESRPYWEAARSHQLALQRCGACGQYVFYARALCPHCHREALEWTFASGGGVVYSFTVVRRSPSQAFAALTPYVVALIDLDEGPRLLSRLQIEDPALARVGQRVTVTFEDLDDVTLPVFEPAPDLG
jgi:uncharacterized protein